MWCRSPVNKFALQDKLTDDLEKNVAKYKKKVGNDKLKGSVEQNQTGKEKQSN
jgi:ribosome-associated translation inhibitor RaiA